MKRLNFNLNFLFLLIIALLLLLGTRSFAGGRLVTLALDSPLSGRNAFFIAGKGEGFYRDEGLELKMTDSRDLSQSRVRVETGVVTFAYLSTPAVIEAVARGARIKIVAMIQQKSPLTFFSNVRIDPKNKNFPIGKRIAISPTSYLYDVLKKTVPQKSLKSSDTVLYRMRKNKRIKYFIAGEIDIIDGLIFDEPFLRANLAPRELYLASLSDLSPLVYGNSIVVHDRLVAKTPDYVRRFIKATLKSIEWTRNNPERALEHLFRARPRLSKDRDSQKQELLAALRLIPEKTGRPKAIGFTDFRRLEITGKSLLPESWSKIANPQDMLSNEFLSE